jgi:hypothetical protein
LGGCRSGRPTLLSGSPSGLSGEGRAVLLFGDPWSADAFRVMEGLGTECEVIGHRPAEALELLQTNAANGIRYAEIDPRVGSSERKTRRGWSRLAASSTISWVRSSRRESPIPKTAGALE